MYNEYMISMRGGVVGLGDVVPTSTPLRAQNETEG